MYSPEYSGRECNNTRHPSGNSLEAFVTFGEVTEEVKGNDSDTVEGEERLALIAFLPFSFFHVIVGLEVTTSTCSFSVLAALAASNFPPPNSNTPVAGALNVYLNAPAGCS